MGNSSGGLLGRDEEIIFYMPDDVEKRRYFYKRNIAYDDKETEEAFNQWFIRYHKNDDTTKEGVRCAYEFWKMATGKSYVSSKITSLKDKGKKLKKYENALKSIKELYEYIEPHQGKKVYEVLEDIELSILYFIFLSDKRLLKDSNLMWVEEILKVEGLSKTAIRNILSDFSKFYNFTKE